MSLDAPLPHCFRSIGPLRNGEDVTVKSLVDVSNLCLCRWLAVVDKVVAHCKGWCLALWIISAIAGTYVMSISAAMMKCSEVK